jgi:hypothetical protein
MPLQVSYIFTAEILNNFESTHSNFLIITFSYLITLG